MVTAVANSRNAESEVQMRASSDFTRTSGLLLHGGHATGESAMLQGNDDGAPQPLCVGVVAFGDAICASAADSHRNLSFHDEKEQVLELNARANKTLDEGVGFNAVLRDGFVNEVALDNHSKKEKAPILLNVENDSEGEVKTLKGQNVKKKFGKKYISGKVVDYDPECKLSKILYENGVEEELEVQIVKPLLVSVEPSSASKEVGIVNVEGGNMDSMKAKNERVPNMHAVSRKVPGIKTIPRCPKIPKTHGKRRKLSTVMTKSQVMSNQQARLKLRDVESLISPVKPDVRLKTKTYLARLNQKDALLKDLDSKSRTPNSTGKARRIERTVQNTSRMGEKVEPPPHFVKHTLGGKLKARKRTADVNQLGLGSGINELGMGMSSECLHVGKRVRKSLNGVVVKFDKKAKSYKVKYDDGDQESLEMEELEQILVPEISSMDTESDDKPSKLSSLSLLLSRN